MVVNAISIPWRVWIGGQEWTNSQKSYSVGWDSFSAGGCTKTGNLVLVRRYDNPESLNSRKNFTRWRPGSEVNIQLWSQPSNSWVQHPLFPLLISKRPLPPSLETGELTLDLTCELGYRLTLPEPDEEILEIPSGGSMTYRQAVINLLIAGQIPAEKISIPTTGWTNSLNFSPSKEGGGSWVQMAIDFAEAENQILYTNSAGLVTSRPFDYAPTNAQITIEAADTLPDGYEPFQQDDFPPHKACVTGVGREFSSTNNPLTTVSESYGSVNGLAENVYGYGLISRVNETRQWGPLLGPGNLDTGETVETIIRTTFRIGVLVSGKINPKLQLVRAEEKTTNRYFNTKGLLYYERTTTTAPAITLNPKITSNLLTHKTSNEQTITWEINEDDAIQSIRTVERSPKITIYPDTADPYTLKQSRLSTQNWISVGNTYSYSATELIPAYKANPELVDNEDEAYSLTADPDFIPPIENLPPAPTSFDSGQGESETQFEDCAEFEDPGGSNGQIRTKRWALSAPVSSETQCLNNARAKGVLTWGRHSGQAIQIALTTELLPLDYPLFRIDIIEPAIIDFRTGGTIEPSARYSYLADATTWEHTPDSLEIAIAGIWIGTSEGPNTGPGTTPYVAIQRIFIDDVDSIDLDDETEISVFQQDFSPEDFDSIDLAYAITVTPINTEVEQGSNTNSPIDVATIQEY